MSSTLSLNAIGAVSVRLVIPWTGVWIADVDLDLDGGAAAPTGVASLVVGGTTLIGTIDPRGSGRFGAKAWARVVGGGAGWDKTLAARHWHNDAGVTSTTVLAATAGEAGEKIVEAAPSRLGIDFVRSAGPASRVLTGTPWYVDFAGVTNVGTRPTAQLQSDAAVLTWDPLTARADVAADSLIVPGTVLTDTRFDGTQTVRDVEQTFSAAGTARATAWCAASANTRLAGALASFVVEKSGVLLCRKYRYRVVLQGVDGRLTLQIVKPAAGVPDMLPISTWNGIPGSSATLTLGSIVLVEFIEGDPTLPIVTSYQFQLPISQSIDATSELALGPTVPIVKIAGGGPFVARVEDPVVCGPFVGTITKGSLKAQCG